VGQGKVYSPESCSKDTLGKMNFISFFCHYFAYHSGNGIKSFFINGVIKKTGELIYLTEKYKSDQKEFAKLVVRLNGLRHNGTSRGINGQDHILAMLEQIPSRL
jgi:hypothetical protein